MKYLFILLAVFLSACETKTTNQSNQSVDTTQTEIVSDTASIAPDLIPTNRMIVPGRRAGLVTIDETAEEVDAQLGKPDVGDAAMGKALSTWYSKPGKNVNDTVRKETNIYFVRNMGAADEASRVKHIRVTSPFFMTAENIGVHSTLSEIQKQYPSAQKTASYISDTKKQVVIYDDIAAGIAFEIGDNNTCTGITIHEPGKKAFETYIAFFRDITFF